MDITKRLMEHYDFALTQGHETVGIFLQGSQNYGLAYEGSDVDSKVIVLPSFEDIVLNAKMVSTTEEMENREHVDLKDIRLMFDCFRKQNINFVEILFTDYMYLNPKYADAFMPLIEARERIAHYNMYAATNTIAGMCMEKYKALEHPYPTIVDKIHKFGYDPKQLHHILRLYEFMQRYIAGEPYAECLLSKQKEYLIDVKRGSIGLELARRMAAEYCTKTHDLKVKFMEENPPYVDESVHALLNRVVTDILKIKFMSDMTTQEARDVCAQSASA